MNKKLLRSFSSRRVLLAKQLFCTTKNIKKISLENFLWFWERNQKLREVFCTFSSTLCKASGSTLEAVRYNALWQGSNPPETRQCFIFFIKKKSLELLVKKIFTLFFSEACFNQLVSKILKKFKSYFSKLFLEITCLSFWNPIW